MISALLHSHISIDEINSLTTDEKDLLLAICNIWAPIRPPMPSAEDPYPITLNIIRSAKREAILDRVIQAEKVITDEARPIYEGLREKLSVPVVKKVEEPPVSGSVPTISGSVDVTVPEVPTSDSGSITPITGSI